jgi:hypothetical protein
MRLRIFHVGAALLLLATLQVVQADPDDDPAAGATPDSAVVGGSVTVKLTPQEMQTRADQYQASMEAHQRRMIELQLVARNAKDIIKLNCVNDKLLQVRQLMNIADDAKIAISGAGERDHAFAQITLSNETVARLSSEAEGCVGEGEMFVGATSVSVNRPVIIDDPTKVDPFTMTRGIELERPNYATPFL